MAVVVDAQQPLPAKLRPPAAVGLAADPRAELPQASQVCL
ncbi:hypothetical protein [Pseudomonas fluorescens]|nr:hypothetical protein [Pseudomonas fluorescens]